MTFRFIQMWLLFAAISLAAVRKQHLTTFPRSSCRPRIWAAKTPVPIKILGTRPRKPRRFFGAISPRYIGTTLKEMPAVKKNREEDVV